MCAFYLSRANRVSKLFEMIVVHCILETSQISDKPTKTVVGLNCILSLKLLQDFLNMPLAYFVEF